ncbi:MAG: UDP-N-acetylmuramoyl-L-alanine--D-glutamate ligase [Candidatus Caenarcaniphilales bacterium]|nr:UDP-N-acetylmuramoyl-L-alanine--D-glutamate ligase [Candidatus Caenarcaniphilales bacterium]
MDEIDLTKRFTILGLGISGSATLKFLLEQKPKKIFISDKRPFDSLGDSVKEIINNNSQLIEAEFSPEHSLRCLETDYLIVSPGIKHDFPLINEARDRSITVTTELELATQILSQSQKDFIGVTGTNGKSTVTTLISHLTDYPACGNIGTPVIETIENSPSECYICELSSFQLAHSNSIKPKVAIITNITPDHISWHGSWKHYVNSKLKIAANQDQDDWLILPKTEFFQNLQAKAKILWINSKPQNEMFDQNSIWINFDSEIIARINGIDNKVCKIEDIKLPGKHNLENAMFSIAAAKIFNVPSDKTRQKLAIFKGLEHRMEFVTKLKGKRFYNDSKATNTESTILALQSFPGEIIWLAGGKDKMTDLTQLCKEANKRANSAILFGEAANRISENLRKNNYKGEITLTKDMEEAVNLSIEREGRVVLLSPACSSFDQFNNFEERGKAFKNIVNSFI